MGRWSGFSQSIAMRWSAHASRTVSSKDGNAVNVQWLYWSRPEFRDAQVARSLELLPGGNPESGHVGLIIKNGPKRVQLAAAGVAVLADI